MTDLEEIVPTHNNTAPKKSCFSVSSKIDGKKYNVVVPSLDNLRIEKIKRHLQKYTKVPKEEQQLLLNDVELTDDMVGRDFGLSEKTQLVLQRRPPQSQQQQQQVAPQPAPTESPIAQPRPISNISSQPQQFLEQSSFRAIDPPEPAQIHRAAAVPTASAAPAPVAEPEQSHLAQPAASQSQQQSDALRNDTLDLLASFRARLSSSTSRAQSPSSFQFLSQPSLQRPASAMSTVSISSQRSNQSSSQLPFSVSLSGSSSSSVQQQRRISASSGFAPVSSAASSRPSLPERPLSRGATTSQILRRSSTNDSFDARLQDELDDERRRLSRLWAAEKREILHKANLDRQELMQENSRLRKELSMGGFMQMDHRQLEEEREVLMKRISRLDEDKANLRTQIVSLERTIDQYRRNGETQESRSLVERYRQELAAMQERYDRLRAEFAAVSQQQQQQPPMQPPQPAPIHEEVERKLKEMQDSWEQEKQTMLRNWREENEILVTMNKEIKKKAHEEQESLTRRFEEERTQLLEKLEMLQQQLNQSLQSEQMTRQDFEQRLRDLIAQMNGNDLKVQSADTIIEELKQQMQKLMRDGDASLPRKLVEMVTQKAIEEKRAERLSIENNALRERLADEVRRRRTLHNWIEDQKGSIRVVIRMRPLLKGENPGDAQQSGRVECRDDSTIAVSTLSNGTKPFEFYKVLNEASSQQEAFEEVRGLIQSAIDGYNVCVLAYGQTGSGKTFTIHGEGSNKGVVPRAVEELFLLLNRQTMSSSAAARGQSNLESFSIKCSMVELYLDSLYDLLDANAAKQSHQQSTQSAKLEIRQHPSGSMFVQNLSETSVSSAQELLSLLAKGNGLRQIASTDMNDRSSRSHTIFTIHIHVSSNQGGRAVTTKSKMLFVDLAGSERVSKSHSTGDRFKEAQHINSSLSSLGDVIAALSSNRKMHVPYRNSKLTMLLQDSIGGTAKTLLFANISPSVESISETVSTIQFAARVRKVYNDISRNVIQQ